MLALVSLSRGQLLIATEEGRDTGAVLKNLPANAGATGDARDMGSSPGLAIVPVNTI